ncbi:hypothetical protein KI387_009279, partial [Taxus chinensis]
HEEVTDEVLFVTKYAMRSMSEILTLFGANMQFEDDEEDAYETELACVQVDIKNAKRNVKKLKTSIKEYEGKIHELEEKHW